ncbi:helix-turn-helix domain-containing protein [uncultured Bacteroides sp.]|uniref:LexA family transcriptional regulator n=1 Tax=uncultured Bacteroides sp. TaxID=162156 RepID=UPI0025F7F078|nr:helix-turn-helix domain-containing protein [uncultured Bacteroides sp.]
MEKEKDLLINVADIVKRAKRVLNFKTDADLAGYLGVSRSTLSNWVARNSIDFPLLLNKLKDVDYNWLLLGKGKPTLQLRNYDSGLVSGEVGIIHNPKTPNAIKDRSVMLYDITAAANLRTLLANKHQYIVGKIQIPSIPMCDGALYISGDSMYPILKSGDIVGFKEISNFNSFIYGEMYLVSFNVDGDEYLAVKYINRSDVEGCIKLVSYNPHHEPMDIPFTSIQAMAIVKFSIRKNMMM